jgi:hypothetical protein
MALTAIGSSLTAITAIAGCGVSLRNVEMSYGFSGSGRASGLPGRIARIVGCLSLGRRL